MDRAKKIYLLPCECSATIEVVTGQAGGEVGCPACGRRVAVPKLRELSGLPLKTQAAAATGRSWSTAQAIAAAGALVAALCWGGAAFMSAVPGAVYSPALIREEIERAHDLQLYQALQDFAEASPSRMPMREEVMLRRKVEFSRGISRALLGLGGIGALAALAAWLGGNGGGRPA